MNDDIHHGACLCGALRYEATGPLRPVVVCHCTQCRRQTGHYLAATCVPHERFRLVSAETLRWFAASSEAERGFCSACGSILFWRRHNGTDMSFTPGSLAGPTGLAIEGHIFCADKGDYYEIPAEGYRREAW